jgi:hypothetical protein
MEAKTYPRQKKEPEMLNDFGPAGGYDTIYPANEEALAKKNNNKDLTKDKKEKMLGEYGNNGGDILNPNEEKEG